MSILHLKDFFRYSDYAVSIAESKGFGDACVISPEDAKNFDPKNPKKHFKPNKSFFNADKSYLWKGSKEYSILENRVKRFIDRAIEEYRKENDISDLKEYSIEYFSTLKYEVGGFFGLHQDTIQTPSIDKFKSLSIIVYMSDFEGGEIVFPKDDEDDIEISPNKGDVVIFPTGPKFKHYVKEITKGTKYVMTLWPLVDKPIGASL